MPHRETEMHLKKVLDLLVFVRLSIAMLLVTFISGCPSRERMLVKVSPPDVKFFEDDDEGNLLDALELQRKYFERKLAGSGSGSSLTWQFGERTVGIETMLRSVIKFEEIYQTVQAPDERRSALLKWFDFYKMGGKKKENVLFTGYYTPIMSASSQADETYRYPLYRLPDDLIKVDLGLFRSSLAGSSIIGRFDMKNNKFLPYYTREEIDWQGALEGRGYEIAYLSDYIDQFFLHIQGGGILELTTGERVHVNYAGKNGKAFVGVGKLLLNDGHISKDLMSMQAIRDFFRDNPSQIKNYCTRNESYVFYERGAAGPYGSLGLVVTPGRSIATDKRYFPGGVLCLISGRIPIPREDGGYPLDQRDFSRFVLDQDTGGAIVEKHIDIYCGAGSLAASQAGSLNCRGDVYMLVLKEEFDAVKNQNVTATP